MKWTSKGVLSVEGKKGRIKIYPGQEIPSSALDPESVKKLKAKGKIDGKLSGQQYEEAQARVEENKRKASGKDEPKPVEKVDKKKDKKDKKSEGAE